MNRIAYLLKIADELDMSGDLPAADVIDSSVKPKREPVSVKRYSEMTQDEKDTAWKLFEQSYTDAYEQEKRKAEKEGRAPNVGEPWTREKFESRAWNWTFFGNPQGYVAARYQHNRDNPEDSMFKLVGTAGEKDPSGDEVGYKSLRSQLKGLIELQKTGKAVWGAVTENIKDVAVKYGFITPSPKAMEVLKAMIPQGTHFSGVLAGINDDGSLQISIDEDQSIKKFYIANDIYYKILIKNALKDRGIPYKDEVGDLFVEFVKNGDFKVLMNLVKKCNSPELIKLLQDSGIPINQTALNLITTVARPGMVEPISKLIQKIKK